MAVITFSTDTYLDNGTARVAGDTWTITNNATLTIRTDSRWYAACPAGLTGAITSGTLDGAKGGTLLLDGRNVRWMAFDSGTGNVPNIGTTVTQGGVSGYLLGVWTSLTSAPATPGTAMPTTGYIKFREVANGPFAAGALAGIGARSASPDVTGWIEVIWDQGTITTLGGAATFMTRGDWFYLDSTTGVAGQTLQTPTCGGGVNSSVNGVQIETAPGSGEFEWYPVSVANGTTSGWISTATGTDVRSKIVQWVSGGMVRIGSDGTTNMGYVPPAGCKVRIPNIICRQALAASRSTNVLPLQAIASRARIGVSTAGGTVDMDRAMSDLYQQMVSFNSCTMTNCAVEGSLLVQSNKGPGSFTDICIGSAIVPSITTVPIDITSLVAPVTFTRCVALLNGNSSATAVVKLFNSANVTMNGTKVIYNSARSQTLVGFDISAVRDCVLSGTKLMGSSMRITSATNLTVTNTDFTDRLVGTTTALVATTVFLLQGFSTDVTIDGVSVGLGGAVADVHPYGSWLQTGGVSTRLKVRNFGTYDNPVNCGSNATFYPSSFALFGALDTDSKYQRLYFTGLRGAPFSTVSVPATNCVYEHIHSFVGTQTLTLTGTECVYRSSRGPAAVNTVSNLFGVHWASLFTSSTAGYVTFVANELSDKSTPYFEFGGVVKFTGAQSVYLGNVGDYMVAEMPYFATGHTGFVNTTPAQTATNVSFTYQIDTGSGYNGTWKVLNTTNLVAETIDPAIGFKLKLKGTATVAGATWGMSRISTASSASAQGTILYPLDTTTLSFEGLIPGSEVRAYVGSSSDPANAVEIGGVESTSGSTWSFTHTSAGQQGYIMVFAMGYQPVIIQRTYQATSSTLLVQQTVDRNYVNP